MFNHSLKKQALLIHEDMTNQYNSSYERMEKECEHLYSTRVKAVNKVEEIEELINSIANTPKEFDTTMGKIKCNIQTFKDTEEYAREAYESSVKAGVGIAAGTAAGVGVATMAPTAMMSIATTFGTATTGTAISALSGAAAQKAALAWIGRTFAGFAVKGGTAGMAAGNAFLALAGPVGWGIAAVSTGLSLASVTKKNKEIATEAVAEAKNIAKAKESLDELTIKIEIVQKETQTLVTDFEKNNAQNDSLKGADYTKLSDDEKIYLGALVNNTLTLSELITKQIE